MPDMTVTENIFLGHELSRGGVQLRRKAMRDEAARLLELFKGTVTATPEDLVLELGPSERQIVEILKGTQSEASSAYSG